MTKTFNDLLIVCLTGLLVLINCACALLSICTHAFVTVSGLCMWAIQNFACSVENSSVLFCTAANTC